MSPTRSGTDPEMEEPKGWRRLWEQAQRARTTRELDAIIMRMNRLLSEHEQKSAGAIAKKGKGALPTSSSTDDLSVSE
jgi:hypothetical protein